MNSRSFAPISDSGKAVETHVFGTPPAVSVIVPVYKVEKYLPKCVNSILAQTFRDFELLLVDDGSPDACGKICDEYAGRDSRIRVFHKANGGVSSARNLGIEKSTGKWICFVDSDDWVEENLLEILHEAATHDDVDLAFCRVRLHEPDASSRSSKDPVLPSGKRPAQTLLRETLAGRGCGGSSCGKLYRTEIIKKFEIKFNETVSMFEDLLFVLQFLEKSSGTFCIQNELYNYLLHAESATHRLSPEFYREGIKAMNLIADEFKDEKWAKPLVDKYKSSTKLKIIRTHSLPRKELLNLWRDASTAGLPLSKRFLLKAFSATPPLNWIFCMLPIKIFNFWKRF